MRLKKDTVYLSEGVFNINIWYQQLYPTKYGIIFKVEKAQDDMVCTKIERKKKTIILENAYYFDFGSSRLSEHVQTKMDSIVQLIRAYRPSKISIVGHTDNIGKEDKNLKLSKERAESVYQYFESRVADIDIEYEVLGKGETIPVADNSSENGRARNRRVELIFK